jgi:hypothetical protein
MSKLTLSVDEEVVSQAKQFAKLRGTSISEMVETYLASVVLVYSSADAKTETPILHRLKGTLKNASVEDYRAHLTEKYQ